MSDTGLVEINSLRMQVNRLEREKSLEEYWTAQVPGKLTYKEIFTVTPDNTSRSTIRHFSGWLKSSGSNERDLLLLLNLDALVGSFMNYLAGKKPETADLFFEDDECRGELKAFLAVKSLETKRQEEARGEIAFFSNFARVEMGKREFLKENRGYMHEALNALVKGVRENPDRLGDLREEDVSKIYGFFEAIVTSKLDQLIERLPDPRMVGIEGGKKEISA